MKKVYNIMFPPLSVFLLISCLSLVFCDSAFSHLAESGEETGSSSGGISDNSYIAFEGGNGAGRCSGSGMPNYWVNTSTRLLVVQDTEFSCMGAGHSIAMTRTYNTPRVLNLTGYGIFGKNWSFSYESIVYHSAQTMYIRKGSGQRITFSANLSGALPVEAAFDPYLGIHDNLIWYGSYWLFKEKKTRLEYRYDAVTGADYSRLTSVTDPNGNATLIDYNQDGTIKKITDPFGRMTAFAYDSGKRCISMTAPDGNTATYQYDAAGNLIQTIDMLGSVTTFTYDASNFMTLMTAAGKTVQFIMENNAYSASKIIKEVIDARGNKTAYEHTSFGNQITDPEGRTARYGSNSRDFTSSVYDGQQVLFVEYYPNAAPTQITYGSSVTNIGYDSKGNMTSFTSPTGYMTSYAYDSNDNLTAKADALGRTWNYTNNDKYQLTKVSSPLGREKIMAYDTKGQLTQTTYPGESRVAFTYDQFGNIATVTDALGNVAHMAYTQFGLNRSSVTDARGNITSFAYDKNNRLTKITHPDNTFKTYTYDCCALTAITDENGRTTTFTRDPLLYLTKLTDRNERNMFLGYDKSSNLTSVTDALGRITTRTYDTGNRLTGTTNPLGQSVQISYDNTGNVTSLTNERSKQTKFTYDASRLLLSVTDPLNHTVTLTRDALARIYAVTNARGSRIDITYDADGKTTSKLYDGVINAGYGYDTAGNLATVNDSTGATVYTYNGRREITGITYPDGKTVFMTFDSVGNISSVTYPGGLVVTYTYDSRDRISGMAWDGNSTAYTRDGAGNITKEIRSNGTESSYAYDANDRIVLIQHNKGASAFAAMAYIRDANGSTIMETRSVPVSTVITPNTSSVTVNDADQIVTWGADSYAYDADGNLADITGSQSFSAVYDNENRPVSINRNGVTTTYTYDGTGSRTRAVTEGQTKNYHYDQFGRLLFETDSGGNIAAYYVYSGRRLAAMQTGAGAVYFYQFDKTGNTVALTDSSGNIASTYAYTPTGEVSSSTGFVVNPFTYVGAFGVMDEGKSLYFMKARYYDARTGRFIQKDPIGFAGGTNLYRYVNNNPVEKIDPVGTDDQIMSGTYDINTNTPPINMTDNIMSETEQQLVGVSLAVIAGSILIYAGITATSGILEACGTAATTTAASAPIGSGASFAMTQAADELLSHLLTANGARILDIINVLGKTPIGREIIKVAAQRATALQAGTVFTGTVGAVTSQLGGIANVLSQFIR